MKPYISPLAAQRQSERYAADSHLSGDFIGYLAFPNGTALAKVPGGWEDQDHVFFSDDDAQLELGEEASFDGVSGAEAVAAIIRRLLIGEATLQELSELSGRGLRRVHFLVTTALPAGGWQVTRIKVDAPAGTKGRPKLNYCIEFPT